MKLKNFCVRLQEISEMYVTKHSVMADFKMKSPNTKLPNYTAYKYLKSCPQKIYTYLNPASKQFLFNIFKKNALKKMNTPHQTSESNPSVDPASIITTPNQIDK